MVFSQSKVLQEKAEIWRELGLWNLNRTCKLKTKAPFPTEGVCVDHMGGLSVKAGTTPSLLLQQKAGEEGPCPHTPVGTICPTEK